MPSIEKVDTHRKALTLNLDPSTFGSFAEIGAGQEVARWFLVVGGASGTVAKTISTYDKEVSDDLYGSGSRYVSKQRLEAILDNEWTQLRTQLDKTRGAQTRLLCGMLARHKYAVRVNGILEVSNIEQTLIPSGYRLYVLRVHSFTGASKAKGRTGSREFIVGSKWPLPPKPASSAMPCADPKADIRLCTSFLPIVTQRR